MSCPDITFKVTTYFKRPPDEEGLTSLPSCRLNLEQALNMLLRQVPDEAITVRNDDAQQKTAIVLDWTKIPEPVKFGRLPCRR